MLEKKVLSVRPSKVMRYSWCRIWRWNLTEYPWVETINPIKKFNLKYFSKLNPILSWKFVMFMPSNAITRNSKRNYKSTKYIKIYSLMGTKNKCFFKGVTVWNLLGIQKIRILFTLVRSDLWAKIQIVQWKICMIKVFFHSNNRIYEIHTRKHLLI